MEFGSFTGGGSRELEVHKLDVFFYFFFQVFLILIFSLFYFSFVYLNHNFVSPLGRQTFVWGHGVHADRSFVGLQIPTILHRLSQIGILYVNEKFAKQHTNVQIGHIENFYNL